MQNLDTYLGWMEEVFLLKDFLRKGYFSQKHSIQNTFLCENFSF